MTPLVPIFMETKSYAKDIAHSFGCTAVRIDYAEDSPRFAMLFKCTDKRKRDRFISQVRLRNWLYVHAVKPDRHPSLFMNGQDRSYARWRVEFDINPDHPYFHGKPIIGRSIVITP